MDLASLATNRMLSVQSHVVSGYCGNKSAVFPLQLLGFEVDFVNSVQLSNHTQYSTTRGQIFNGQDLDQIFLGLKANQLLPLYENILSGYVADVGYIESLGRLVKEIKTSRQALGLGPCWYTLDPVLGDDGPGYYVPNGQELAKAYKRNLIPLADIITPNRFEASVLSGIEIEPASDKSLEQAIEAIRVFHQSGVKIVVITSFELSVKRDQLTCLLSYAKDAAGPESSTTGAKVATTGAKPLTPAGQELWSIAVPRLDCPFTGTGDLFSALLTGWLRKTNFDFKLSLEYTANSIHEVLEDTLQWSKQFDDNSALSRELKLVQNKDSLVQPKDPKRFQARALRLEAPE